jgi:hypothetical protein
LFKSVVVPCPLQSASGSHTSAAGDGAALDVAAWGVGAACWETGVSLDALGLDAGTVDVTGAACKGAGAVLDAAGLDTGTVDAGGTA